MNRKFKIITAVTVAFIAVILYLAFMTQEKENITGQWIREDNVSVEFFSEGVWESEEAFEGIGGIWKLRRGSIIMEDLLGNTFEATLKKDEKGEYIVLNGEVYYKNTFAK